jgi:hypothetical protein
VEVAIVKRNGAQLKYGMELYVAPICATCVVHILVGGCDA